MATFTLLLNGYDYSDCIQQEEDIIETLEKIYGPAQGEATDGTTIPNLIRVKWHPSFLLKPLPRSRMNPLISMMELETISLSYTSIKFDGALRTIEAMPVSMSVQYATTSWDGERVYRETPISFQEV